MITGKSMILLLIGNRFMRYTVMETILGFLMHIKMLQKM